MASEIGPPPADLIGQVTGGLIWGITMVGLTVAGIWRYFAGKQKSELIPPTEELTVKSVELVNTGAVSDKIISYLQPKLEELKSAGLERDHKIDDILERLRKQESRDEFAKAAREEVARQLDQERSLVRNREQNYPRT